VDLLAGGQGVLGIAVGHVWQEVAGELATVTPANPEPGASQDDLSTSHLRCTS
jgi:hypothetical protein